ncbi:fimbrial protein [Herbaspirillum sp. YR522]|uniref:fimbrial protein n=1 Tax=Herbaspirillum sp. YR522 TaxID=1144342 RepID=UPI00026F4A61|nr:fimbrial protein [Herbaspirillum sp. YR522]EJN09418.1 P pilus assembly protein, pilin FimA [Herbaspirillum sp. YR522]
MKNQTSVMAHAPKGRLRFFLPGLIALLSGSAFAQCSGDSRTVNLPLPATITPASNAPVGTVLTSWIQSDPVTNYLYCYANPSNGVMADFSWSSISNVRIWSPDMGTEIRVWETTVAGIGVALIHRWYNGNCRWSNWEDAETGGACSGHIPVGSQVKVALVKTGPVRAGRIQNMTVMRAVPIGGYNLRPISWQRISFVIGGINIVAPTCRVTTTSVAVQLAPVNGLSASTFTGHDSSSTPVPFELKLTCGNNPTRLGITFTDTSNPANAGTTLPLSASSSARGLGVQILHKNAPVRYGYDSSRPGTPGQITLDLRNGGQQVVMPLAARYIQTGPAVTPGSANAQASFTISYQ